MGSINPNGQTALEQRALRKAWEALPRVQAMSRDVLAVIKAEGLEWDEAGLTRAFELTREWEKANGDLPDSGIRATG
jgi:hypothetical protein